MKKNQRGFRTTELLIATVIVGVLGVVGWIVYDKRSDSSQDKTAKPASREPSYETAEGIEYTVISDWKDAKTPFASDGIVQGNYLLSPDYKEAGGGQLDIKEGAFIHFGELEVYTDSITSGTTVEQAAGALKNIESYFDPASVKTTEISGKQVVTFNAGHTTDGVTVLYRTAAGKWLDISFSTTAGGSGYTAQQSPHYETFLNWLDEFLTLN